jgi:hypothetical protein
VKVTDFEANPEEKESLAEHQEVPNEEASVETIGALDDKYGDRHLAVGCLQQPKKLTQGNDESWQNLCRRLTRRAVPALRQGPGRRGLARRPATESEDESGDRSYFSKARGRYMRFTSGELLTKCVHI